MKAIDIIKESRQTHIEWRDYFLEHPDMEKDKRYKKLGGVKFHQECIDNYNEAISDIINLKKELKNLRKKEECYDNKLIG